MSVKITPRMPKSRKDKNYSDMKDGDFFISGNLLFIKCDFGDQNAICIQDGNHHDDMCNYETIPVDVEIKWTREPKKKGKK